MEAPESLTYSQHAVLNVARIFQERGINKIDYMTFMRTLETGRLYEYSNGNIFNRLFSYLARREYSEWIFTKHLGDVIRSLESFGFLSSDKKRVGIKEDDSNVIRLGYNPHLEYAITDAGLAALKLPRRSVGFQRYSFG